MEFKPLSGREFPRFSGIKTFFRLPIARVSDPYDVGLFGVPFDGGVSYRPGARFAPSRIREMSSLGRGYHWTRGLNFFEKLKVADLGDCSTTPISLEQTYKQIEAFAMDVLKAKKRFVAVGGDHSTSLPLLRALKVSGVGPVNLIHFDAHLDTYPAAWGFEYHHGAWVRHAIEEGLVRPGGVFQFGIRGPLAGGDDLVFVNKHKINVSTIDDLRIGGLEAYLKILPQFSDAPTYLSFDVDCLDPAYAPGTGTPVPGGLTTYEVQRILRSFKIPNLVAADIVEVSPSYDTSDITSMAAVDVMFEILCTMAQR
jgi:guanidinopropionase